MYARHKKFIWGFVAGTFLGGYVWKFVTGLLGKA
jgi:hypothetical protein